MTSAAISNHILVILDASSHILQHVLIYTQTSWKLNARQGEIEFF